jgi:hypothetical protein
MTMQRITKRKTRSKTSNSKAKTQHTMMDLDRYRKPGTAQHSLI